MDIERIERPSRLSQRVEKAKSADFPYARTHEQVFAQGIRNFDIVAGRDEEGRSRTFDLSIPGEDKPLELNTHNFLSYLGLLGTKKSGGGILRRNLNPLREMQNEVMSPNIGRQEASKTPEAIINANAAGFGWGALNDKDPEKIEIAFRAFEVAELLDADPERLTALVAPIINDNDKEKKEEAILATKRALVGLKRDFKRAGKSVVIVNLIVNLLEKAIN